MGSKGVLGLALCFAACGDSGSSGLLRRPSTTKDSGLVGDASAAGGAIGVGSAMSSTGGRANAGGSASHQCQSDRDCTPLGLLCDHARSLCVQCLVHVDCNHGESCQGGVCQAPIQCTNSLDCVDAPDDRVICNQAAGNCVQCLTTDDCATGVCQDRRCTTTPTGNGGASNGGSPGSGGFLATGGSTSDTGGSTASGGSTGDTGGLPNTGGFQSTGGFSFTGGFTSTGGFTFTGGFTGTGGRASTGGSPGTGGAGGCVPAQCPACPVSSGKCCTAQGQCGCNVFFVGTCTPN